MTAEKDHAINFSKQQNKFCLSSHYNQVNNYLFVNSVETYKLKAKYAEINAAQLCLGNVSKDFPTDNIKNIRLYRYVYDFSVNYDSIDVDDILESINI